jgi:PAS domain S-box-containing protein
MRFERIETKLIALITVALVALVAVSMFFVIHSVEGSMREDFNSKKIVGNLIYEYDFNAIDRELEVALEDKDVYYAIVTDEKGTLIRSKFKPAGGTPISSEYLVEEDRVITFNGVDVGNLQMGFSLVRINQEIRELEKIMAERLIIKPINELIDGVRHISKGDFSYQIPTERNDQFGELTGAFNQMSAELKSKTEAIVESEEKYRAFVEGANDAIVTVDSGNKVTSWNKAAQEMLGYKPDEIIGEPVSILVPEKLGEEQKKVIMKVKETGFVEGYESIRMAKDGTQVPVEMTVSSMRDEGGEVIGISAIIRDITERKKAERAILESEEKFRNLVETSPDMIFIIDRKSGKILDINDATCKLLGYKRDEIIGTTSGDRILPVQKDAYNRELESLKKTGRFAGEFKVRKKDGSVMPVEVRGASFGNYSFAMGTDITERKRAEKVIRESEEKFRNLYQTAQVGLFRTRISDGKMIECNDRLAQIAGYDKPEDAIAEYVASEHYVDPNARKEMLTQLNKSGGVRDFEVEITRRDGTPIWISFSAHVYPQEGYLEGVLVDITARKLAEERIMHYVEELETLSEIDKRIITKPDLTSILDFVVEKATELTASDVGFFGFVEDDEFVFKTFCGMSVDEGGDFRWKIDPNVGLNEPMIIKDISKYEALKLESYPETSIAIKNEGLISFLAVPFLSGKGDLLGRLIVASRKKRRFTENQIRTLETLAGQVSVAVEHAKLNEEMKAAYKELKSLDRFKSDIISSVGHELRTPIEIISKSLESLRTENDVEDKNQLMNMALKALNRQNQIVDDLVTAAVYAKKSIELNIEPVDIGQLITLLYSKFKPLAEANKVKLSFKLGENIPLIRADFNHLEHLLRNIIQNALKFTRGGGKIAIEAKKKGEDVVVCVSDSGIGIPQDKLKHIFDPLYQGDASSDKVSEGIGMGLAVAKELVMAHGGDITAESKEGRGSKFCFSLPIEARGESAKERYVYDVMKEITRGGK